MKKGSYIVSPIPKFGTHNEMFPTDDMYRNYYHSFDTKRYGSSELLDVLDRAEFEVDLMNSSIQINKTKSEPLLKAKTRNYTAGQIKNPRRIEKARRRIILHTQRPFEKLKSMLLPEQSSEKLTKSGKEKLPRKLKKELAKNE